MRIKVMPRSLRSHCTLGRKKLRNGTSPTKRTGGILVARVRVRMGAHMRTSHTEI
jgi:hypothetical protein